VSLPRSRRLLLGVIVAALVLVFVESGSCVFFRLTHDRFALARPEQYVQKPEAFDALRRAYDRELGWTHHYDTPFGERPRAREYGHSLALAFGDSFTHGDEVAHDETWPQALAELLEADVYNFGVGGYGLDQALLRFRQVSPRIQAPLVLIAFELRNIDRVVNRYRPFLLPGTGIALPKPRFVLRGGRLELLPNPVTTAEGLDRLADPAFVESMGEQDYWYSVARGPRLSFPYTRLLFDRSIWSQALAARSFRGEVAPRPDENLWQVAGPRALYLAILDAFVAEVTGLGSRPVLVLLPGFHAFHHLRRSSPVVGLDEVLSHCGSRGYTCFDGLTALVNDPQGRKADVFFRPGGHTSPAANRLVAASLAEFLRRRGLADRR
jgi:hypothetical protein